MLLKSVTLEMSNIRGWLKADAFCRVEGKCSARCSPRQKWRRGAAAGSERARGMAGGRLGVYGDCGAPMEGTGGAHREHGDHVSDTGSVETQRLVERRRTLQSRKESTYTMRVERDGGEGVWGGAAA